MHKNLKRALAVSAVAPLAFFAGMGSAGAVIVNPTGTGGDGPQRTSATCTHPDFNGTVSAANADTNVVESLRFQVDIFTSGDESGSRGDVTGFQWRAVDNNQNGVWHEDMASVKRVTFSYLDNAAGAIPVVGSPVLDNVIQGPFVVGTSARDGYFSNSRHVNDVLYMKFNVTWDMSGPGDPSDRTVTCYVALD